ncbi:sulfite exporter TauE/SafE family protein [Alkalilimnicola ehrlichii]|uniref:sulfite exporter TauE/SafE family protein n=1 Tax=Alkalilimnicola ehrlichii TaxID=351052 RepID=UPI0026AEEA40|nr:sulfite exporter TauE/SafE family protein [Alkalilimnicola ehrlichii]
MLLYLVAGTAAGLISGLFGVGGGTVIVPVLLFVFALSGFPDANLMHLAVGTSLAAIVLTSISSVRAHMRLGGVLWPIFWRLLPGIIVGSLLGAVIADLLSSEALRNIFGVFLILVGAQMLLAGMPSAHRQLPGTVGLVVGGTGIGTLSAMLGIGGGSLTVPWLAWCGTQMRKAVGTSAACGLPIAVFGALGFVLTGWGNPALPSGATGYVYWPAVAGLVLPSLLLAPVGARLAHRLPPLLLKRIFGAFLILVGLRLLFG